MSRRGLAVAASGLLVVAGCRGGQKDAHADEAAAPVVVPGDDRPHPIGELAHGRDYTMSVESIQDCPLDPPFAPRAGNVKVGLEVTIQGASPSEVPVNPFYATLYDETGESYSSTLAGCEPSLPSVRVTRDRKARGFITFEIPKTSRKLTMRYAPVVIGRGAEETKFAMQR